MLLSYQDVRELTEDGVVQCDLHLRVENEKRAWEHIHARNKLLYRFLPFVWLQDQNLEPIELLETVAGRLLEAAQEERERRQSLIAAE